MLKLIRGKDKRNPIETLSLDNGDGLALMVEGSTFSTSNVNVIYSGLQTGRDGQKRVDTTRDNAQLDLTYRVNGVGGPARITQLQRDLFRWDQYCREYEESGLGDPVYLAYRANDGLDLPEPVFGQFSTFVRVLHIDVSEWAGNIANPSVREMVWGQKATLTVAPYAEGAEQACGVATGAIKVDPTHGLVVMDAVTGYNQMPNPSFEHSTWDFGWTAAAVSGGAVIARQETAVTRSYNSALFLAHDGGGTGTARFTQSLTTAASEFVISFYAKSPSGDTDLPTSANFTAIINGSSVATRYNDNRDGWFRCWADATGSASAADYGVEVKTGQSWIFDNFQLEPSYASNQDSARPFMNGEHLGAFWNGGVRSSTTNTTDGSVDYSMGREFSSDFTVSLWITPVGILYNESEAIGVWAYDFTAPNEDRIELQIVEGINDVEFRLDLNGVQADSDRLSIGPYEWRHVVVVGTVETIELYVNGATVNCSVQGDVGNGNRNIADGTFKLGYGKNATKRCNWAMDGLRIWGQALTSDEVAQLYSNERSVKDNYDLLGLPPFLWTHDADGNLENDMDTTNDDYNYAVLGGVSGDLPAETELTYSGGDIDDMHAIDLGLKAVEYRRNVDMNGLWWYKSFTEATSGTGKTYTATISHADRDLLKGISRMMLVLESNPSGAGTSRTYLAKTLVGDEPFEWDTSSNDSTAQTVQNRLSISDIMFQWPEGATPADVAAAVFIDPALAGNWVIKHMILLPSPYVRIRDAGLQTGATTLTGLSVRIKGTQAWGFNSSNEFLMGEHLGNPIEALPNRYNWIFSYFRNPEVLNNEDVSITIAAKVTPRFNLLGGPIA